MAATQTAEYATVTEWDNFEDAVEGYNDLGDCVIIISARMDRRKCLKWGDRYVAGRTWAVMLEDGTEIEGHAKDLRVAKKEALAALTKKGN